MDIPEILLSCETHPYGQPRVKMNSGGKNIYVISDLHLASGLNADGNYDGTENFFADESLARFLDHIGQSSSDKKCILIINGDFIDFLRIRDIPSSPEDFAAWHELLTSIGIKRSPDSLKESIVKKERKYGLKTDDYKSAWKLLVCQNGHPLVFARLASWLLNGNLLAITKGNHDLEWYWMAVRNGLRWLLARRIATAAQGDIAGTLMNIVIPGLSFADNQLLIDEKVLVEHGHRYQKLTAVQGAPVLENQNELNLPFGSFFNRYLLNRLELAYPYFDNIRPSENLLPVLLRERFPLAIRLLFNYIPFMLLIIPKKLYWETFKRLISFVFIIVVPIALTVYAIWQGLHIRLPGNTSSFLVRQLYNVLLNSGFLFLSYIFGRIMVVAKLSGTPSLYDNARNIFETLPDLRIVTFGHTHDPEQFNRKGQYYFNTGTWIPVYEISAADVRLDKTYTYLHIRQDSEGNPLPDDLMRWNDDASRVDPLVLRDKK